MKIHKSVLILISSAVLFTYASPKNEYVYDCLFYHTGFIDINEIVTFLCDQQHHIITYFQVDIEKKCSNHSQTFRTCDYMGTINFQHCQMDHIPYDIFPAYRKLHTLNISSMELETLKMEFFAGANELKTLNVSNNRLKVVQSAQFSYAKQLQSIDLSFNQIHQINDGAFDDRSGQLKTLDLSHNNLSIIESQTFAQLSQLVSLNLSNNRIKSIDFKAILAHSGQIGVMNMKFNELIELTGYEKTLFPQLWIEVYGNPLSCEYGGKHLPLGVFSCVISNETMGNAQNISHISEVLATHTTHLSHIGVFTVILSIFGVLSFIILIGVVVQLIRMQKIVRNELGMRDCSYSADNNAYAAICRINDK